MGTLRSRVPRTATVALDDATAHRVVGNPTRPTALQQQVDGSPRQLASQRAIASGFGLASGSAAPLQALVLQREVIGSEKIDVVNDAGYPKWEQNGKTYHITMITVDSMHVTEEASRQHYHFSVDAGSVKSKRPKKDEVGSRFKDHHTLDQLPDSDVVNFVKKNITAIMKVK